MAPHRRGGVSPPNRIAPHRRGGVSPPNRMAPHRRGGVSPPNRIAPHRRGGVSPPWSIRRNDVRNGHVLCVPATGAGRPRPYHRVTSVAGGGVAPPWSIRRNDVRNGHVLCVPATGAGRPRPYHRVTSVAEGGVSPPNRIAPHRRGGVSPPWSIRRNDVRNGHVLCVPATGAGRPRPYHRVTSVAEGGATPPLPPRGTRRRGRGHPAPTVTHQYALLNTITYEKCLYGGSGQLSTVGQAVAQLAGDVRRHRGDQR